MAIWVKKTILFIMAAGIIAFRAIPSPAQQTAPVTVPVYEWEPYSGRALRGYGLATQLTTDALIKAGYKVKHTFVPWKRALEVGKRGDYEVIAGIWYSAERNKSFIFSRAFLANELIAVCVRVTCAPAEDLSIQSSLSGKSVGLVRGYFYPDSLLSLNDVRFQEGASLGANLKKLFFRRIDVVTADRIASNWLSRRMFGRASGLFRFTGDSLYKQKLFIGISRKSARRDELLAAINSELDHLATSGELKNRVKQYIKAAIPEVSDAMQNLLKKDIPAR